jgi:glutamyl-tRNA reductase
MSELAARNLRDNGAEQLVIINRTHAHAVELAQALGATHRTFAELGDALALADVVISSTTAPRALITVELVRQALEQRTSPTLLLIDIALPRDVEPAVAQLPGIHLYNLDDLQQEVERGIHLRMREVEHVQAIIAQELAACVRWLASLSVSGTISDLRQHVEALRQQELERTMRQLAPALSEHEAAAVQELTTRLVNKLLHTPMLQLKAAAVAGQGHIYAEALRYLFHLEDEEDSAGNASHKEGHEKHYDRHTGQQASAGADAAERRASASALARP